MELSKLKEPVSLAGSVASITGISLLWLKELAPQSSLAFAVPIYLVASLLAIGIVAFAYLIFQLFYGALLGTEAIPPDEPSISAKLAYIGLVGGGLLFIAGILVFGIFYLAQDLLSTIERSG